MKTVLLLLTAFCLSGSIIAQDAAQNLPPYKRYPTIPPIRLLMMDSTTWLKKEDLPHKKAVMIMLFSPDCDHCKHETEEILRNIDKFKKIVIVMATTLPFDKMKQFYRDFSLYRFPNIVVGRDVDFIIPVFYNVRNMPYLAFYDKKGNLIDVAEGSIPVDKILEKFKQ